MDTELTRDTEVPREEEASARPTRGETLAPASPTEEATSEALDAYLRSIGDIPVLTREQEVELAQGMEQAEADFRDAILAVPATAVAVLERWHEKRRAGRVTAALSAQYRDVPGPTLGKQVDSALRRLESVVERRAAVGGRSAEARRQRQRLDARAERLLREADIALELLAEITGELEALLAAPTRGPEARATREARRRRGLRAGDRRAVEAARDALERRDEFLQRFVRHNLRLVIVFARRYRNLGVAFPDLIQEGNLGLIRAVEKFDHRRGFKFSTYAVWWIQQSLVRAIQNHSRTVRVPSHIYELQLRQRKLEDALRKELGRAPSRDEMAERLEVEPAMVDQLEMATRAIASTHSPIPGTDSLTLEDVLPDESGEDPEERIQHGEEMAAVGKLLDTLSERERHILEMHYGLSHAEPVTLDEIGKQIGLSRERVRQIEVRAVARLRDRVQAARRKRKEERVA